MTDSHICGWAEKEQDIRSAARRLCRFLHDIAQEHFLAFSWIISDPKETAGYLHMA